MARVDAMATTADAKGRGASHRGKPGLVLGGKYELQSPIGSGGMGSVWRAVRLDWQAPVAVKLMTAELAADPKSRERFEREVRLAASLRSPHVVQVLDHGVDDESGMPFLVMELLEGETLAQRIKRLGVLSPLEVCTIVDQLSRALSRAHAAGVVHRDLKPQNVFLVPNGQQLVAKVLDFGVAKSARKNQLGGNTLTRPGHTVGTPHYMSPELFRGVVMVDHRVDLWSLAVITCESLTGRRPFEAPDFPSLAILLCGGGPRPSPSQLGTVPQGFDDWFRQATATTIEHRFQSAEALSSALAAACGVELAAPLPSVVQTAAGEIAPEGTMYPMSSTNPQPAALPVGFSRSLRIGIVAGLLLSAPLVALLVISRNSSSDADAVSAAVDEPRSAPQAGVGSPSDTVETVEAALEPALEVTSAKEEVPSLEEAKPLTEAATAKETPEQSAPPAESPVAERAAPSPPAKAAKSSSTKTKKRRPKRSVAPSRKTKPKAAATELETIEGDRVIRTTL